MFGVLIHLSHVIGFANPTNYTDKIYLFLHCVLTLVNQMNLYVN